LANQHLRSVDAFNVAGQEEASREPTTFEKGEKPPKQNPSDGVVGTAPREPIGLRSPNSRVLKEPARNTKQERLIKPLKVIWPKCREITKALVLVLTGALVAIRVPQGSLGAHRRACETKLEGRLAPRGCVNLFPKKTPKTRPTTVTFQRK